MKKEKHMPRMPNTHTKGKEKNIALARRLQKSREGTISRGSTCQDMGALNTVLVVCRVVSASFARTIQALSNDG